jgi:hypothetical protein
MSRLNPRTGDQLDRAAAFLIGFVCAAAAIGYWFGWW